MSNGHCLTRIDYLEMEALKSLRILWRYCLLRIYPSTHYLSRSFCIAYVLISSLYQYSWPYSLGFQYSVETMLWRTIPWGRIFFVLRTWRFNSQVWRTHSSCTCQSGGALWNPPCSTAVDRDQRGCITSKCGFNPSITTGRLNVCGRKSSKLLLLTKCNSLHSLHNEHQTSS